MKSLYLVFTVALLVGTFASPALAKPDLSRIYGNIKVVDSFPDFKVKVVNSFQDLNVQKVTSFPSGPGKWKFVKSFPDYKIQFVDSFPDFTIKYVTSFPGVRNPQRNKTSSSNTRTTSSRPRTAPPRTVAPPPRTVAPPPPKIVAPPPPPPPPPAPKYSVGETVIALVNGQYYAGKVLETEAESALLDYGQGKQSRVKVESCQALEDPKLSFGDQVLAPSRDGVYRKGKIIAIGQGTYFIKWESGEPSREVERNLVLSSK